MDSFETGAMLHRQGRIDKALDQYIKALDENGYDNAQLLYLIGTIMFQQKKFGMAIPFFRQSIMLDKNHFGAWNNLGTCYKGVNKEKDAAECWNMALTIKCHDHDKADVYNNLGTIHINAGTPEQGFPIFEKALSLRSDHPDAHWNRALCNLEMGKYGAGFDEYHWGFKTGTRMMRDYNGIPFWDGAKGKHIIVWGEQGIGDEILFASMINELVKDSASVVFDCHPRLMKLFKNSFPTVAHYGTRKDASIEWFDRHKEANAKISIGDLGKFYRRDIKDFPKHNGYLKVGEERSEHFKKKLQRLGDKPKVGISWTGGYVKTRRDHRSIPLDLWEPILKQDADFISLQYTPEAPMTVGSVEDKLGVEIQHWSHIVNADDYHETAALINNLDLIITVNTSIHHLAGALGKKCWTMTPFAKAWRYWSPDEENKIIPWYPSVTQYQQKELYKWEPVINRVARDLKEFLR